MLAIPFDAPEFRSDHLEEFVARFLSSEISLTVDGPHGLEERRILRAYRGNKAGGVVEGGVDIIAKVEGGETWGFECKLYTDGQNAKWNLNDSIRVLKKAIYPADRFFLVAVSRDVGVKAIEHINKQDNWEFWDADTLASQFLTRVPENIGIRILTQYFNSDVAAECYGIPCDKVLISGGQFFRAFMREGKPFNHLTKLTGRNQLKGIIDQFVANSPKKVLLISGKGGEGKSRTLAEFADQFATSYPDRPLRFVNPYATNEESEESLSVLLRKGLVVVHEDAHRIETIRKGILATLAREEDLGSKIIITTRPQGVEIVRSILSECGLTIEDIEVAPVPALTNNEMVELAEQVLGSNSPIQANELASLSDRSPLICVVGGNLIRTNELLPSQWADSDIFKLEVFSKFEQQNLESLTQGNPHQHKALKDLLRTLASLAPYSTDKPEQKALGEFLGIRPLDIEYYLARLEVAEIIFKTNHGWRVGPDLFADHLVYTSSIIDGESSIFCDELVSSFGSEHFPTLLRNLSEAEWRARVNGQTTVDLTNELWEGFVKTFQENPFWERSKMLETWSAFSYFLPEKSIELAKLSISLDTAPEHESVLSIVEADHLYVVEKIAKLLQPIGIYNRERQFEVFDLLASLGRTHFDGDGVHVDDQCDPWVAIAKASSFAMNQPLDSVTKVVEWVGYRWESKQIKELIDHKSSFLSIILSPVFQRTIERSVWVDLLTTNFQTILLCAEETAPMRKSVFDFIEKKVIPRSEIAALNIIPVLKQASDWEYIDRGRLDNREWRIDRIRAIEMLNQCAEVWDSEFVRFSIWRSLINKVRYESDQEIIDASIKVLDSIDQDLPILVAFSTLGEGSDVLPIESDDNTNNENAWDVWLQFNIDTARRIKREFTTSDKAIEFLQQFEIRAKDRGITPNWGSLVTNLVKVSEDFANKIIGGCLSDSSSLFDRNFGSILHLSKNLNDDQGLYDRRLAKAIRSPKSELQEAALDSLRWGQQALGPKSQKAVEELLINTSSKSHPLLINVIGETLKFGGRKAWSVSFLDKIPFTDLSEGGFEELLGCLATAAKHGVLEFEPDFLDKVVIHLEEVDTLFDNGYQQFLDIISKTSALHCYNLIRNRIRIYERIPSDDVDHGYYPTPFIRGNFVIPNLNEFSEYNDIVEELTTEIRSHSSDSKDFWKELFQAAVLLPNTETGIGVLDQWLEASSDMAEVESIASIFNVIGTATIFKHEDLLRKLLAKSAGSQEESKVRNRLLPKIKYRGYSNGMLNNTHTWVLDEARKGASRNAGDPILKKFFEFVIRFEEQDRQTSLEHFQDQILSFHE